MKINLRTVKLTQCDKTQSKHGLQNAVVLTCHSHAQNYTVK